MPDEDQQQKLMPLLGKYVRVSGRLYERNGTRAIVIDQIEELKDVHLTIGDR
jgi:DNA/RNA endonuclease YhcR with UshA esterase domain